MYWNPLMFRCSLFPINVIARHHLYYYNNWMRWAQRSIMINLLNYHRNCIEVQALIKCHIWNRICGALRWPLIFHLLFCAWIYAEIKTSTRLIYVAWFMESGSRSEWRRKKHHAPRWSIVINADVKHCSSQTKMNATQKKNQLISSKWERHP